MYALNAIVDLTLTAAAKINITGLEQGCQMVCFQTKKSQFGLILEGFRMEIAGIFYGHLEYYMAICDIFWPFGNVVVIWYILPCFGILCQDKSGYPGLE
jgi:hypothetical protein